MTEELSAGAGAPLERKGATAKAMAMEDDPGQTYTPMAVLICNWADLFPWLATGYQNAIDDITATEDALKFRMAQQDFLTLSRLYHYASDYDFEFLRKSDSLQIADNFARQYSALAGPDIKPNQYRQKFSDSFNSGLGSAAQAIYKKWDEIGFLRNAELGLGVVAFKDNSSPLPPQLLSRPPLSSP